MCLIIFSLIARCLFAEMDWENMIIKASGSNSIELIDALKQELYSLQYDEYKTVGDILRLDFDREQRLMVLLNTQKKINQHYLTDGSIEYIDQLSLTDKFIALLLPQTKPVKLVVPMLCPCCGQEWPSGRVVPEGFELVPKQVESSEHTGIIIDCRGFKFNPSLFPKICNEISEEIYSVNFADPRYVIEGGLVLYTTKDLFNNPRIGYNPLRILAIGVIGEKMTNIKISSFDARRIHGSKKNLLLLRECRIAIIFGP